MKHFWTLLLVILSFFSHSAVNQGAVCTCVATPSSPYKRPDLETIYFTSSFLPS